MNDDRTHGSSATSSDADDAWLDRLLADDAQRTRDDYIGDGRFSARVIAQLPPPVALPAWRTPVVVGLWATASVGLALALPAAVLDVGREVYRLLAAQPLSLSGLASAALAMGALTWAGAAYALRGSD